MEGTSKNKKSETDSHVHDQKRKGASDNADATGVNAIL